MNYYADRLSASRLKRCYELASPRVMRYLEAEIDFVRSLLEPDDKVLEFGCGYGRVLARLEADAREIYGIDNSVDSLTLARAETTGMDNLFLAAMNAEATAFKSDSFDKVICIQNGISAFHVDRAELIAESVRLTEPGGLAIFSTYSEKFWAERLGWFEAQSAQGLIGEIDYATTGNGKIVCRDGFAASTVSQEEFDNLTQKLGMDIRFIEIDDSSLFCVIAKPA